MSCYKFSSSKFSNYVSVGQVTELHKARVKYAPGLMDSTRLVARTQVETEAITATDSEDKLWLLSGCHGLLMLAMPRSGWAWVTHDAEHKAGATFDPRKSPRPLP